MNNTAVIRSWDIQVLSAGSGITHSEYNKNKDKPVKLLQIWVLPNKQNVSPRYDQISLNIEDRHNKFQQVLSPNSNDSGVWIHQEALFSMIDIDEGKSMNYRLKNPEKNGVYLFVLNGKATINNQLVEHRDGYGLWNTSEIEIVANSNAELLLMEVPMSNR